MMDDQFGNLIDSVIFSPVVNRSTVGRPSWRSSKRCNSKYLFNPQNVKHVYIYFYFRDQSHQTFNISAEKFSLAPIFKEIKINILFVVNYVPGYSAGQSYKRSTIVNDNIRVMLLSIQVAVSTTLGSVVFCSAFIRINAGAFMAYYIVLVTNSKL